MMKRGMTFLLSSAAVVAMTAGFAGVANAGAGGCCDQVEDLQRQIYLLQSQIDELKANPGGLSPKWKASPEWKEDGYKFKVRGRIYADYGLQDVDLDDLEDSYHGSEFRTARLGVEGQIASKTKYKIEADFSELGENEDGDPEGGVELKDAYIQQKVGAAKVTIGNFKTPNSLEEQTSSRYITFVERAAITDAFGLARQLGVGVGLGGDNWTFNVGAFGSEYTVEDERESYAFAARGTFAPIAEDTKSVHLGASVRYRGLEDDNNVRYRQRAVANHINDRHVDTGNISAQSDLTYGVEAAGVWGPFSVQGEYMRVSVDSDTVANEPSFYGWYVDASVFLTGESRSYKADKGSFGRVKVANPVNDGGLGAWQLAVRYDYIDLTDTDFEERGTQGGILAGVNWHLNNYTRLMLNYGYSDVDDAADVDGNGDVQSVTFRAQVDW